MTTTETGRFPEGFLFGAATAAYQIEGSVDTDGRGRSIWDTFSHTPGKVLHGDTGDVACDHYRRVDEDVELMAEIGLEAYRFSIAWPRIQPDGSGAPLAAGLDHYRRLVDRLRARDIAPYVTLYHWDLPQALQDQGGWERRETAERFAEYAAIVAGALLDGVEGWITLNEPWVSSIMGYGTGEHAPGLTGLAPALRAAHHLLLGHGLAVDAIRSVLPANVPVGVTLNLAPIRPATGEERDVDAARLLDGFHNRWFLDPVLRGTYPDDVLAHYARLGAEPPARDGDLDVTSRPIDFLGVNYYTGRTVAAAGGEDRSFARLGVVDVTPPDVARTAMGWPIDPHGLTELLVRLDRDYGGLPCYVTENGAAFVDYVDPTGEVRDLERVEYLEAHLRAALAALEAGVDLRGYFAWSLLDNFEWAEGYAMRFGLVYVDYATQRRVPKQSASWYAKVIASSGVG